MQSTDQARGRKCEEGVTKRGRRPDPVFGCSLTADASRQPHWILEGLLEEGEQLLLYGNPKAGKSQLGLQIALCVALDLPFLGWPVAPGRKVLYVNLEMGARAFAARVLEMARELLARPDGAAPAEEIPVSEIETKLSSRFRYVSSERSLNVLSPSDWGRWRRALRSEKPDLVFIDTLAKAHAADENVSKEMTAVMQRIRGLFDAPEPEDSAIEGSGNDIPLPRKMAHVLIHHAGKSREGRYGGARIRGSSAIHGEADLIFYLMSDKEVTAQRLHGPQRLEIEARNFPGEELAIGRAEKKHTFQVTESAPLTDKPANGAATSIPDASQPPPSGATPSSVETQPPSVKAEGVPSSKPARKRGGGIAEKRILELLAQRPGFRLLVADVVADLGNRRELTKAGVQSAIQRMVHKYGNLQMSNAKPQKRNLLPLLNPNKRKLDRDAKAINLPPQEHQKRIS